MRSRFIGALTGAAWIVLLPAAGAETYKIDPAHSSIAFSVHQFFNLTHGKFKQFAGTVVVDRENPERSSVSVRIQVRSIDTGIRKRDDHLLSAEFFDAAKYPEIVFQSRGVKRTGAQSGDIAGDLIMHGVKRPLVLHVELLTPASAGHSTELTRWRVTTDPLKRRDFNLLFNGTAEAVSGIGQDVTAAIEIEATKVE